MSNDKESKIPSDTGKAQGKIREGQEDSSIRDGDLKVEKENEEQLEKDAQSKNQEEFVTTPQSKPV